MGALLGLEVKADILYNTINNASYSDAALGINNPNNVINDEVKKEGINTEIKPRKYIISYGLVKEYYYSELKWLNPIDNTFTFENNPKGWFILPTLSSADSDKLSKILWNHSRIDVVADHEGHLYKITPYHPFDNIALTPLDLSDYYKK